MVNQHLTERERSLYKEIREAFVMGKSYEEIAESLSITVDEVMYLLKQ